MAKRPACFLTVRVRLPEGSSEALFSARNPQRKPVPGARAVVPWLGGRPASPGKPATSITTSKRIERDIYEPGCRQSGVSTHTFGHHHLRLAYDPIHLLPMMDLSDEAGGLSYIKYEQRPSPHILVFENPLYTREEPA